MSEAKEAPGREASAADDGSQRLQEKILAEYPRLGLDDQFTFGCHPGVSCFNCCCSDVNIFLSPYDVLRLRKRLGITSGEFLDRYALVPVQKDMKTPVVLLRMRDDAGKACPFLTAEGCGVYSDRPWPCRMYPLGMAAAKDTPDGWRGERFWFLLREDDLQGLRRAHLVDGEGVAREPGRGALRRLGRRIQGAHAPQVLRGRRRADPGEAEHVLHGLLRPRQVPLLRLRDARSWSASRWKRTSSTR